MPAAASREIKMPIRRSPRLADLNRKRHKQETLAGEVREARGRVQRKVVSRKWSARVLAHAFAMPLESCVQQQDCDSDDPPCWSIDVDPEGFSSSEDHGIDVGTDSLEALSNEGHKISFAKPSQNNVLTDTSEDKVHSGRSPDIVRESI